MNNTNAAFIMPHWTNDFDSSKPFLTDALESLFNQNDQRWSVIIVDDCSPCEDARSFLKALEKEYPDKVKAVFNDANVGPGQSRNIGVEFAYRMGMPFILFNDADDISHKKRVQATREIFESHPHIDVVYSSFEVIDEFGAKVEKAKLTQSIQEILEGHQEKPLMGHDVWIDMGITKGYTNLTSTTSVRTSLAYAYPFPKETISEDFYAWMVYSAGGQHYYYADEIPSLYRISQNTGSATRARVDNYYEKKAEVDEKGFLEALRIAQSKNDAFNRPDLIEELLIKFYLKLAETLSREQQYSLAILQMNKAQSVSKLKYEFFKKQRSYQIPLHIFSL